ncbi:MAG TPA: PqiC family protein [Candidatus Nitrosotalea sp.]|nr:PqiC family protein [Candidatus Nitrosotalea sp.]
MMRQVAAIATFCALAGLAAGCGTSPPSRFYTLTGTAGTGAAAPAAASSSTVSVVVASVSVPATVDRPQIVVNTGANQVGLDEFNRWASPLQSNIQRTVAENLVALLGSARVTQFLSPDSDFRVAIEVQRFESTPGDSAVLDAAWVVRRAKDGKVENGRTTVREATPEKGYDALVAAHSRAVGRLSQDIAAAVRALDRASR